MEKRDQKPCTSSDPLSQPRLESGETSNNERERAHGNRRREVVDEVKKQLRLAGPLAAVNVLSYSITMISVMFAGHLGKLSLSGASMATSFAIVTGFILLIGLASALETLSGQSFGAKQYHMLGILMQRAMLILLLVSIPLSVIWANTEPILLAIRQDAAIAAEAGRYARFMIPSLFAYGPLQCLVRFLQMQNNVLPMMISSGITTLLHIILCWVLVFKSGLGSRGAAVANSISYWINVVLLALYVKFSYSCATTWTGFSKKAFHGIFVFLKLAIPSAFMICLECWGLQIMVILAGLLPNSQLETSVISICSNTIAIAWMIPFGFGCAVSTRVSNELGAGHPKAARLAVLVVVVMAIVSGSFVALILILIRNVWGYAFSKEKDVVEYVARMIPILVATCFIDGLQAVLSGNARGCGWQKIGAYVNLGSYYLVGIPSAVVMAFVLHIGGKGLWLGLISALIVQFLSLLVITVRTNWDQEAKNATERVYDSIAPVNSVSEKPSGSENSHNVLEKN